MIDVAIVDENGRVLQQLRDEALVRAFNHALAQHGNDPAFCCLRFLDPYGDTIFNYLQAKALIGELDIIAGRVESEEARASIEAIRALATEVSHGNHIYLKFIGD